jgi:two-component system sensor histidine kinase KdpD
MSLAKDPLHLLAHELEPGLLSLELRLRALLDQDGCRGAAEASLAEVTALRSLVRDVALLSGEGIDRARFSLAQVLVPLRARFTAIASAREIRLEIPDTEAEAIGDPRATERVLSNLLANAIDVSPADAVVRVAVLRSKFRVAIEVEDRGIGIAPEDQERIFLPFVRLDPGARGKVGLGLAVARALATAQNGTITLSSTPGAGSRFILTLPAK